MLWAQSIDADQWADDVLDTLSTKAQLAQLLILKKDAPDASYRYGIGGWEIGTDEHSSLELPSLFVDYLSRDASDICASWSSLVSSRDTIFIQEMGYRRAATYLEQGVSVLGIDTLSCTKNARQMRFFAHYLIGLCSSDLSCVPKVATPAEIDLEASLPLALTENYEQDVHQLSKKWGQQKYASALRAACRRVLIHKYRTVVVPRRRLRSSSRLADYLRLKHGLLLLKNQAQLLPLQALDTVRLASVAVLSRHLSPLLFSRLDDYLEMPHYLYSKQHEGADLQQLSNYSHIIVSLHPSSEGRRGFSARQLSFIDSLRHRSHVIWLYFGSAASLVEFPVLRDAQVLLLAHEDSPMAQDLAAQALFGGIGVKGRLEVEGLPFKVGTGLRTSPLGVLSFVPPEVLGIDAEQLSRRIDRVVYEGLASRAFPGCQVLLVQKGRVFFYKSYGHHTYQQRIPVTHRSIYDLASLTKVMAVTASLMRLDDEQLFSIDEPLATYLPKWRRKTKGTLDFRHMLAHHAGLYPWIPYYQKVFRKTGRPKRRYISSSYSRRYPTKVSSTMYLRKNFKKHINKAIERSELSEPKYRYSGLAFYLLPEVIERLSGYDYTSYLQQFFYAPLGASTLGFLPTSRFPIWRIAPTEEDTFFRKELIHGSVHDEGAAMMGGVSGNAGLFAKAVDVAKLFQMLLQQGTYGGRFYLSPEVVRRFTTCQFCEEGNRRGLGFDRPPIVYKNGESSVAPQASTQSFGHTGFTGTIAWADPEQDLLFVFLSNRVHPSRANKELYERNIRPRIHQIAYEVLESLSSSN